MDSDRVTKGENPLPSASEGAGETLTIGAVTVSLSAAVSAELAAEERRWRAQGRPLIGQMESPRRSIAAATRASVVPQMWTPVRVMDRLEEAFEILARLPMATRPKGHQSLWPGYSYERGDLNAQIETGELDRLARARNSYRVRGATSAEVARMEQALGWAATYLKDMPEVARAVHLGALWAALRVDIGEACVARRINRHWFRRRQLHGLNVITVRLIAGKVPVS